MTGSLNWNWLWARVTDQTSPTCNMPAYKPSGRGGTDFEPEDRMTRTTGGDSQLWQLTQNTQEPKAAASALQELPEKGDARPGSERQSPHSTVSSYLKESLKIVFKPVCPLPGVLTVFFRRIFCKTQQQHRGCQGDLVPRSKHRFWWGLCSRLKEPPKVTAAN